MDYAGLLLTPARAERRRGDHTGRGGACTVRSRQTGVRPLASQGERTGR